MSFRAEALSLSLLLKKSLEARFLFRNLLGAKNLLDLGILRLRLGLAVFNKGRELVLVCFDSVLTVVHFGNNQTKVTVNQFFIVRF